jgi:hypothetical protein
MSIRTVISRLAASSAALVFFTFPVSAQDWARDECLLRHAWGPITPFALQLSVTKYLCPSGAALALRLPPEPTPAQFCRIVLKSLRF